MTLVDANILIYAFDRNCSIHYKAKKWLDDQLNGTAKTGLPWASLLAFARIVSNPRIYEKPVSVVGAWNQVVVWLGTRSAWVPNPTEEHHRTITDLLKTVSVGANDLPDVHLAALAVDHGLKLCSTDSGFARFPQVEWINPLV